MERNEKYMIWSTKITFLIGYMGKIISMINDGCIIGHDCSVTKGDCLHDFSSSLFMS